MAGSVFKEHRLDIIVGSKLDEKQMFEIKKNIQKFAAEWQAEVKDAKIGAALSDNLDSAVKQINKQLSAYKLEPIDIKQLEGFAEPFAQLGEIAIQKFASGFGMTGNALDAVATTVGKIYDKMESQTQKSTSSMIKNISQVEAAAKRVGKNGGFKDMEKVLKHKPTISSNQEEAKTRLVDLARTSQETSQNKSVKWEAKYLADIEFVDYYEKYVAKLGKTYQKLEDVLDVDLANQITKRYNTLMETYVDKSNMLQNIVALKNPKAPKPFVGYDKGEPWAREDTLQEIKGILQGEVTEKKADTKKSKSIKAVEYDSYRAIEDDSSKTKERAIKHWGAEYWASGSGKNGDKIAREVATSYAENFFKDGSVVRGKIKPINPLIFNADGAAWNEFDKIKGVKELFPEIVDLMKKDDYIDDDGQKFINEMAKKAGFDSVIFENVRDSFDQESADKADNLSTTIAVLDDHIVELIGAYSVKDNEVNFENKLDVPSYYHSSDVEDSKDRLSRLQQQQASYQQWFDNIMSQLEESGIDKKFINSFKSQYKKNNSIIQQEIDKLIETEAPQALPKISPKNKPVVEADVVIGDPITAKDIIGDMDKLIVDVEPNIVNPVTPKDVMGGLDKIKIPVEYDGMNSIGGNTSSQEQQRKLLLYRVGKTTFNKDKWRNQDAMGNAYDSLNPDYPDENYGGFGDGLFMSTLRATDDLVGSADKSYFEIDASDYDLYINQTVSQAKKLREFLLNLQRYILSAGDFRGYDEQIKGFTDESLFNEASSIFERFQMSKDEFSQWIKQQKDLVVEKGFDDDAHWQNVDNDDPYDPWLTSHNFGTRFMKTMGYEGVLNDTGHDVYDGYAEGSVLFDPDFDKITAYIEQTKHVFKTLEEFQNFTASLKSNVDDSAYRNIQKYINAVDLRDATHDPVEFDDAEAEMNDAIKFLKGNLSSDVKERVLGILQQLDDQEITSDEVLKMLPDGIIPDYSKKQTYGQATNIQQGVSDIEAATHRVSNSLNSLADTVNEVNDKLNNISDKNNDTPPSNIKPKTTEEPSYTPGSVLDNPMFANMFGKTKQEVLSVDEAFQRLVDYIGKNGQRPDEFFDGIINDSSLLDDELKNIFTSLKLIDDQGRLNLESITDGNMNLGGMVSDKYTLISRPDHYTKKNKELVPRLTEAKEMGANVGDIIKVFEDKINKRIYELQSTVPGKVIADGNDEWLKATDEQVLKLIEDLKILQKVGLYIDFGGDNVFYDPDKGFSFIDLTPKPQDGQDTASGMASSFMDYQKFEFGDNPLFDKFRDNLESLFTGRQGVIDTDEMSTESTQMKTLKEVIESVTTAVELKTKAFRDEADAVDSVVTAEVGSLERLDSKIIEVKNKFETLLADISTKQPTVHTPNINEQAFAAEGKAAQEAIDKENQALQTLRANLKLTTERINTKTDAFVLEGKTVGQVIGKEISALKQLDTNIKPINDKLIDLINNLKKIKTAAKSDINVNVNTTTGPAPRVDRDDWKELEALHSKLGKLKARFDDTSDPEIFTSAINLEEEIELKYKSLNLIQEEIALLKEKSKVAENAEKRIIADEKEKVAKAKEMADNAKRARDIESLYGQYEKLGKLQAQAEMGDSSKAEEANQLEKIIQQEIERLGLNNSQNAAILQRLKLSQQEAKENQARILAAKKSDKDWKKRVKDAQKSVGVNRATSVINTGDQTVNSTIGVDGISQDIEVKAQELATQIDILRNLRNQIEAKGTVVSDDERRQLNEQANSVNRLTEEMKGLLAIHEKYSGDNAEDINGDASSFKNLGLDEYEKQLTAVAEASVNGRMTNIKFNADTKELTGTVKTGANAFTTYSFAVDEVTGKLVRLNQGTKKTETFMEGVTRKTKELAQYALGSISIYDVWNQIRQGVTYIREIDSALTELKKVTDETEESYDRFLDTASKTASKVGSTVKDIINSTADWAKLGYSMEQAHELAASTSVLLNVSEFDSIDSATSALISTMQAFSYTADESMHVVDIMNIIGNNFAVSTDGLATALQDAASALMTANNSYEEAAAMVAAANKVVQNPSEVGGALRTIALRLRGTKVSELEAMGEDTTGAVETQSKLRGKLKGLTGIDILTDTGAYKSTYDILLEISKVWDDLTDENRAGTLELIAGKNRANVASALLSNTKDLEEAYATALDAEGSAWKENEKYLDSINGKIAQFTNAWQTMWNNLIGSEIIKTIVDWGTVLVNIVDKLGLVGTALVAITLTKFIPWLLQATTSFTGYGAALSSVVRWLMTSQGATKTLGVSITNLIKLLKDGAISGGEFASGIGSLITKAPIAKILLIAAAIWAVVKVVDLVTTTTEEYAEKLQELKSELSDIQSELDSLNTELETTQSRIAELLAMDSLTFTEQEELNNLQRQNDELERQIYLLEQRQKRKQKETEETFVDTVGGDLESHVSMMGNTTSITTKQHIESNMGAYRAAQEEVRVAEDALIQAEKDLENVKTDKEEKQAEKEVKKAKKEYDKKKKEADIYYDYVSDKIEEYAKYADGIDYDVADDETKALLDYIYDLEDKFNIVTGDDKAKEIGIRGVFNKEEFSDEAEQINKYVESLKNGDASAKGNIENIINNHEELKQALSNKGLDPQDAIDYFTQIGSAGTTSIDELVEKIEQAKVTLEGLLNGSGSIDINTLFDADGNVDQIKLSEVFKGTDEITRKNLTSVLKNAYKQIQDGTLTIEDLLIQFGTKSSQQVADAIKESLPNAETFNSTIDSIQEAYDTLTDVVKQYNSTGYLTLDNLQALLSLEPEYLAALQMENGQLSINQSVLESMIQTRLAEAEATAVESAIKELNALAARTEAEAIDAGSTAANNAINPLSSLSSKIGEVAQQYLIGANSAIAFANAVQGAQNNKFVSQEDIDKVLSNFNTKMNLINSVRTNLPKSFGKIVSPDKSSSSDKDDDKRLENLQKKYEGKIKNLENQKSWLENEIAREEEIGLGVSKSYYEEQIKLNDKLSEQYEKQRQDLINLKAAYPEGSEKWYEVTEAIWDMDLAIQDLATDSIKAGKSIIELYNDVFSKIGEAFDNKTSISDDRISSMQNYAELLDLQGGTATKGLYDKMIAESQGKLDTQWAKFNEQEKVIQGWRTEINPNAEGTDEWKAFELAREQAIIAASAEQRQLKLDMQDTEKQLLQLKEEFKELATQAWDNVRQAYSNKDTYFQNQIDLNDKYIEKLETLGINVPDEAYQAQIDSLGLAKDNKLQDYLQARKEMIDYEGIYGADSQEYIDKAFEVTQLYHEYLDYENEMFAKQQQVFDNQIDRFNQVIDRVTNATKRMQNISDLLDGEDVATEDGEWTAEGLTQLGMAYQQMEYYKQASDEVANKMREVEKQYRRGEISEKKYYETMQELEGQQWDMIDAVESQKDAIIDLNEARIDQIENGLEKEIEAMEELIQLKKDELSAERD